MLRAAGYDARHVSDNADHVWNEYWSEHMGRWVHVDCCEAAWDQPLLYEGGWGKKVGFVLAASRYGHADVTRYTNRRRSATQMRHGLICMRHASWRSYV